MVMDKEIKLLPILQRFDSLKEDVNLLIEKLENIKDDIKEIRKDVLELWCQNQYYNQLSN